LRTDPQEKARFQTWLARHGKKKVEETVIVELKSVREILPLHRAQVITYLKLSGKRLGLLINFNVPHLRDGVERIVL
jgi:GxxExxY protein